MVAFTTLICERQTRLHFSHGEIIGNSDKIVINNFKYPDHEPQRTTRILPEVEDREGHGGGDFGLMKQFVCAVKDRDQKVLETDIMEILKSHLVVFAAEKSRKDGTVVDVEQYEAEVRGRMRK